MRDYLNRLPDTPRWIEARGMLLAGCGEVLTHGECWVVRNQQPGGRVVVLASWPQEELLEQAISDHPEREVLCCAEYGDAVARLLPHWKRESAVLYELVHFEALPPVDSAVKPLEADDPLDHLESELAAELAWARQSHTIHTLYREGRAVSFAYAHWITESLFDISIDTDPNYRRQGLAATVVAALIREQMALGRQPVWGAMASNVASARLAEKLGFSPCDEVVSFCPPT